MIAGPRRAAEIFQAYATLVSLTRDAQSLEAVGQQILEDARLTRNQQDALMDLAYSVGRRLQPDHPAYGGST